MVTTRAGRLRPLLAVVALVAALVPLGAGPVGAQATTDVYVVHGLNLIGQASQDEGGTPVTVCTGPQLIDDDLQFGEVVGPLPLPALTPVPVQVYRGAGVDCEDPGIPPLIDQAVEARFDPVALVASAPAGEDLVPGLVPFDLAAGCVEPGLGRLVGGHAAAAGTVEGSLDGAGAVALDYSQSVSLTLSAGPVTITVETEGQVVFEDDITIEEFLLTAVFVVGNQPTVEGPRSPVVGLVLTVELGACPPVTTPPAGADGTTTPSAAAPSATATPRFTG